jgi:hypothetical protein
MNRLKELSQNFLPIEFLSNEQQIKLTGGIEDKRKRPGSQNNNNKDNGNSGKCHKKP